MILKLEPYSGISGDMFLGALAPLLNAEADICALPARLGLEQVEVRFHDVIRSTIQCRKATVTIGGEAPEALGHGHTHGQTHGHGHGHAHDHPDHNHTRSHAHRSYTDIVHLLHHADLTEGTRRIALDLFRRLGEAEAEMHGISLDEVHFHEVGAEDAIVDLVGAALLIDRLQPEAVYSSPVCVGSGFINTAHGRLPVPAPATQKLLQGFPTFAGPVEKEMTTPTGAVILAALNPHFTDPTLICDKTGLGAGTRDLDQPNALRLSLCRTADTPASESIHLLQSNLDNITPEDLGSDLLQNLLDAGSLDAWLTPVLMKKGRPGHLLEVLCTPGNSDLLSTHILQNLPTLGVRCLPGTRSILKRESATVTTRYGDIALKIHHLPDGTTRVFPEYESCRAAALAHSVPTRDIRLDAIAGYRKNF
ncbi:MAG: nickel pincer cofactor biosynthesis protein LarC [Kiritimatiellia bacterium]